MSDPANSPDDLRARAAAMLVAVRVQQAELQRALDLVSGDASLRAELGEASGALAGLAQHLSLALASPHFPLTGADLVGLGQSLQATSVASLVAQATARAAAAQELAAANAATRGTVQTLDDDLFNRHLFDSSLRFASSEDEETYREREADRQRYITLQLGRNTPQGNLNAAGAEAGQMLDIHAHAAGNSPEWQSRWDTLTATIERQRAAMIATGQSTEEYDRNIRADVRRFLTAKGLTDSEITDRLVSSADPLDAVKPFIGTAKDAERLQESFSVAPPSISEKRDFAQLAATPAAVAPPSPALSSLDAIAADMKAAGVSTSATDTHNTGHGVSARPDGRAASQISPA